MPSRIRRNSEGAVIRDHSAKRPGSVGLKLTVAGSFYIAATLLFGFAAVNTGNNLLFIVVSTLLAFMAVSGTMGWLNMQGLEVELVYPDEVYRNVETLVTVTVRNRKRRISSYLVRASVPGGTADFVAIDPASDASLSFFCRFPERGSVAVTVLEISSPYPINLFVRSRWVEAEGMLTVFPTPLPSPLPHLLNPACNTGDASSTMKGTEGEMIKIGTYSGREPVKLIHWPLSAKHDELKVKELAATLREPVLIEPELLPGRTLEEKLSRAAYLLNHLFRNGRPVGMRMKNRTFAPDVTRMHRLHLLSRLADYEND